MAPGGEGTGPQAPAKPSWPLRRLRERHQDVLRQKLYKLKQEQGVESQPLFPIIKTEPHSPSHRYGPAHLP